MVEVRTNRPDFDRLVNTWLPYQLYASRLFARVGPNQRGGATGYRDQLQDVLPLIVIEPRLTRAQIVLHAGQQFLEGDVLKWWHRAPNGGTGIGQRTKASDPHLWLPYVLARYVAQTGDRTVLDVVVPYLEAPHVPEHEDTLVVASRPSREVGDVYEHSRRAIEYTLRHMGANGLPLLGAGDWNDGIDALGSKGIGTSVWMGFFFFDVLSGFIPIARAKRDEAFAQRCEEAREAVRAALEVGWQGDHYALDFADDGSVVGRRNAMTTGWAAHSGAVDFERAVAALEGGLKGIERPIACSCWKSRSSNIRSLIPAASRITHPASARTAANTATARPGSSTASCVSPARRAPRETRTRRPGSRPARSRFSRKSRR